MRANDKVKTPIGVGVCQGGFGAGEDPNAEPRILVRLPVNETTRGALWQRNCLTPHAEKSGLWVFPVSQTGGALLEFAILLALGLLCAAGVWLLLW